MKPGRNYIATSFCAPPVFYLSFFPGGSSNLSLVLGKGYSLGFFRLSKSFLPSRIGVPSQKSAALCLTTKGEKNITPSPPKTKTSLKFKAAFKLKLAQNFSNSINLLS